MTNPVPTDSEPLEEYRTREERRAERRAHRDGAPGWILGAILIVVGLVIMGQNFGIRTLDNWWALFILIPAAGAFGNAWRTYQATGSFAGAGSSLVGGAFLTLLALFFLFGWAIDWRLIGPLFLIVGGGLLLAQALRKQ